MTTIHVNALAGSDAASGLSPATAVQTIGQGMARLRAAMPSATADCELALAAGQQHNITSTIVLGPSDNRTGGRRLRFRSYGVGQAVVTGRTRVTGWVDEAAGLVSAPFAGNTRDLWCDGAALQRATLGRTNTFYRVFQWEEATRTVLISSSLVPVVPSVVGLEMVIQMGWSISHMPVTSIVDAGSGLHRVSFTTKAASAEFAKGNVAAPGLGTTFALGPYHNDLGQRFWWQNSQFQFWSPGDWWFDPVAQRLWVRLPTGVANAAAFDALGVYVPNGATFLSIPESFNFDTPPMVENVDVTGLTFRNFGAVPVDREEGFIGYLNGASLFDNAGAMGFRLVPAILGLGNCRSVTITNNQFYDMSCLIMRGQFAIKGLRVRRNVARRLESGGIVLFGVTSGTRGGVPFVFDTMPRVAWNEDIEVSDNALADGGLTLLGGAIFGGAAVGLRLVRNTVKRWTDNGIEASNGARHFGLWVRDNTIAYNDIEQTMTVKVDGGAIYSSGNVAGTVNSAVSRPNDGRRGLRIFCNRVRNVRASGFDPAGGFATAIYQDLGSHGTVAYLNDIADVDVAFKTNAAGVCTFQDNLVVNVIQMENHSFAGANIFNPGTNTSFPVFPPLANPPSVTDQDKFFGRNGFNSFQAIFPFSTPESVITPGGVYNSLSVFERNGPTTPVQLGRVGAPDELLVLIN